MSDAAAPMEGTVSDDPLAVLTARLDHLEQEIASAKRMAEDAQREAQDAADDVDRLQTDVDDLEDGGGDEYDDDIRELRDEIRYLTNRLDRLEIAQRSRSKSA